MKAKSHAKPSTDRSKSSKSYVGSKFGFGRNSKRKFDEGIDRPRTGNSAPVGRDHPSLTATSSAKSKPSEPGDGAAGRKGSLGSRESNERYRNRG